MFTSSRRISRWGRATAMRVVDLPIDAREALDERGAVDVNKTERSETGRASHHVTAMLCVR